MTALYGKVYAGIDDSGVAHQGTLAFVDNGPVMVVALLPPRSLMSSHASGRVMPSTVLAKISEEQHFPSLFGRKMHNVVVTKYQTSEGPHAIV